jgi:hypothetical protein
MSKKTAPNRAKSAPAKSATKGATKPVETSSDAPVTDQRPADDRDPNNSAVFTDPPAGNPPAHPGETSVNQAPRAAVSSEQLDQEQQRTADSLRDRAEGKVDSKTAESAGQRRAARANVIANLSPGTDRVKVRATEPGYYDHARRRAGDVFTIDATPLEEDIKETKNGKTRVRRKAGEIAAFSDRWMEFVDDRERESVSTSTEALGAFNRAGLAARRRGEEVLPPSSAADADPLGSE